MKTLFGARPLAPSVVAASVLACVRRIPTTGGAALFSWPTAACVRVAITNTTTPPRVLILNFQRPRRLTNKTAQKNKRQKSARNPKNTEVTALVVGWLPRASHVAVRNPARDTILLLTALPCLGINIFPGTNTQRNAYGICSEIRPVHSFRPVLVSGAFLFGCLSLHPHPFSPAPRFWSVISVGERERKTVIDRYQLRGGGLWLRTLLVWTRVLPASCTQAKD